MRSQHAHVGQFGLPGSNHLYWHWHRNLIPTGGVALAVDMHYTSGFIRGSKNSKINICGSKGRTRGEWRGEGCRRAPSARESESFVCLFVGCLTSRQHASVSQGRICTDNITCCHTEIEAADQTFYLTQSQYTDTGPTSPSADPITPGAWQGSHWSANF